MKEIAIVLLVVHASLRRLQERDGNDGQLLPLRAADSNRRIANSFAGAILSRESPPFEERGSVGHSNRV